MTNLLATLCRHSPVFLQNLGVSLYGLRLYVREYGLHFERRLRQYEERARWSAGELENYQNEQLRRLIRHCYENVPYYREVMAAQKLAPDDLRTVNDLAKLPVLTPEDVTANFERLIARTVRRSTLIEGQTSGTTRIPRTFLYDREVCRAKSLAAARHRRWGNIGTYDRTAVFLGKTMIVPLTRTKAPFWRHNWVMNHLFFSAYHLSRDTLESYVERLADFAPRAIEGFPSIMSLVATYLLRRNRSIPVTAAFTSSEILFPPQREAISRAFCCPVFDYYGMAERAVFATECEAHEGLHVNSDFGIAEILTTSGCPAGPEELGRVVATGLHNYAMPLIRYQTNDFTSRRSQACSCGRGFPLLTRIIGRQEDMITTPEGRFMDSLTIYHPFERLTEIKASQVVQETLDHLRVRIVRGSAYTEKDSRFLIDELQRRLGPQMNIELEFVDSIPRSSSGKFRWVVSKIPLEF